MRHVRAIPLPAHLSAVALGAAPTPPAPEPPPALPPPAPQQPDPIEVDRARVQVLLARLADTVEQLALRQQTPLDEIRQVAVELGMAVAARLIHTRIQADEHGIEAIVRATLDRLPPQQPAMLRLHPDDLALLQQRLGKECAEALGERRVELVADASLQRGDCKAQSGELAVWSELRRSLDDLRELLLADTPFLHNSASHRSPLPGGARAST